MYKPIYNRKGWVLGSCDNCGSLTYVEPHGTTAHCKKCRTETEHSNIPHQYRDYSGTRMIKQMPKKNPQRGALPVGRFIPVQAVRQNADGTVTVKVAAKHVARQRNPAKTYKGFLIERGRNGYWMATNYSGAYSGQIVAETMSELKHEINAKIRGSRR